MEENDPGQRLLNEYLMNTFIWFIINVIVLGVLMIIHKIHDGSTKLPVTHTISDVTNTGAPSDDDYDDVWEDFEHGDQISTSSIPNFDQYSPDEAPHMGDVTVNYDDSDSELCTGQSFGVRDEGYISMMQVKMEQKLQKCKDDLEEMLANRLAIFDEKKKSLIDWLQEKHHKQLSEQRRIWREELEMKLEQHERTLILEEEFKLDQERRRFRSLMDAKLEERRNLIAKREVQVIDLKRKYGLSDKQKSAVDKILKKLNMIIRAREKEYKKNVKKIKTEKHPYMEQCLIIIEAEKKLYKVNNIKRKCNVKLLRLENTWIKNWPWIVRVASLQKIQSNNSYISTCSISSNKMDSNV